MAGRFLGLWKLLPETSKSDNGPAAVKGAYLITAQPGDPSPKNPTAVDAKMTWTDAENNEKEIVFHLNVNSGEKTLQEHHGRKMLIKNEIIGQNIFKTTGFTEDDKQLTMEFIRELKEDGKFMDIEAFILTPIGAKRVSGRYQKIPQ
jgi:hypothetical protein